MCSNPADPRTHAFPTTLPHDFLIRCAVAVWRSHLQRGRFARFCGAVHAHLPVFNPPMLHRAASSSGQRGTPATLPSSATARPIRVFQTAKSHTIFTGGDKWTWRSQLRP